MNRYKLLYDHIFFRHRDLDIYYIFYDEYTKKYYEVSLKDMIDCFNDLDEEEFDKITTRGNYVEFDYFPGKEITNKLSISKYKLINYLSDDKNKERFIKKICIITLTSIFTFKTVNLISNVLLPKIQSVVEENNEEHKADANSFDDSLDQNTTLSDEIKELLKKDLTYLVNYVSVYPNTQEAINKRIDKYDFSNITQDNYNECLMRIIFANDDNLSRMLTNSLIEASHNLTISDDTILLGELLIEFTKDDLTNLINSGTQKFNKLLASSLNIDIDDANLLLMTIQEYKSTQDEETKGELIKLISTNLTRKYKENNIDNDYSQIILSSNMYNGPFRIINNIFANNIIFAVNDPNYQEYYLYYDRNTLKDISLDIYKDKLRNMIDEKGSNLDYNDPDCRFIFYLYYLCFHDTYHSEYQNILSIDNANNLTDEIINRVFSSEQFVDLNKEFLYGYLCNGNLCFKDLPYEIRYIDEYSFDVAMFREYQICIEKELESMNITEEERSELLDKIEDWINRKLESENEELYNEYIKAIENDSSLFQDFSIYGDYEYQNEDIKKYEYKSN